MAETAQYRLMWGLAVSSSDEVSQQWVLSAMSKHGSSLVTLLWRILGNEQDVCDAYQDTFLQLTNCRQGQKPQNVKAYLFRTASNTAISMLRRRLTHEKACKQIAGKTDDAHHIDYAGDMDAKDLQQRLRYHVTRLPSYLRAVVVLRDLAELPYRQVADILGITPGSARVFRRRAIKLLAAYMTKDKKKR